MVADPRVESDPETAQGLTFPPDRAIPGFSEPLLRGSFLLGANASGKSNFVEAIAFLRELVLESHFWPVGSGIDYQPYRGWGAHEPPPSILECSFIFAENIYTISVRFTTDRVLSEKVEVEGADSEKRLLLERSLDETTGDYLVLPQGSFRGFEGVGRKRQDGLLLSLLAVSEGLGELEPVHKWFKGVLQVININQLLMPFTEGFKVVDRESGPAELRELLVNADTGITDLVKVEEDAEPVPDYIREVIVKHFGAESVEEHLKSVRRVDLVFSHSGKASQGFQLSLGEQSSGTRQFLGFLGEVLSLGDEPRVMVVDEIENKLHPMLLNYLVDVAIKNGGPAPRLQILATTHMPTVLDTYLFRPDMFWFAQKKPDGTTIMNSASEYDLTGDASLIRLYMSGLVAGVPSLPEPHRVP